MKNNIVRLFAAFLAASFLGGAAFCADSPGAAAAASGYHLIKKIPLADDGFWDYLSVDGAARRLYISRGNRVTVVDIDSYTVAGEVTGLSGVHGAAIAPELGRGFISNGRSNTVTVFDTASLKTLGEAKTGEGPDSIIYDPASRRVFAFNGKSKNATVIEASSDNVVGTVALDGRPEFAASDANGRVYVNLEDKSAVAVIDSLTLAVTAQWSLSPCEEPSGMAIDALNMRLFVGCSNKMMAVVNAATGVVITTMPIGDHVDANTFDPKTGFAFSSNGDGTLTVVHEDSPDKYSVAENVVTQKGARTMALDPVTHRVFLMAASYGPAPAPTEEHPHPRPQVLPGTVTLLVFGQ